MGVKGVYLAFHTSLISIWYVIEVYGDDNTGEYVLGSLLFVALSKVCSISKVILESQQKTATTLTIVAT